MEQLHSLIKKLLQFRFVRFCITGGLNTLVDFIVFFLLTGSLKWPVIPSQVISYSAGILNSYCINRRWTFQTRNRFFGREMLWFIGVNLCVLGVSVLSMWVLPRRGLRDDPQQALHHCPDHGAGVCTQPAAGFPQPCIVSKNRRPESRAVCFIISLCVRLLNYK